MKFYAVAKGRKTGIYTTWPECQKQVTGFEGAVYKSFKTRKEAEEFIKKPTYGSGTRKSVSKPKAVMNIPETPADITIHTDGGAIGNPGPGGYGVVIMFDDGETVELKGGYGLTTNNRMELLGVIKALQYLTPEDRQKTIRLHSDSQYVLNAITKGWAEGWRKRGWIKSDRKPALNPDLWEILLDLLKEFPVSSLERTPKISFKWVKGHAGDPMNERCDELANSTARASEGLPADPGYRP